MRKTKHHRKGKSIAINPQRFARKPDQRESFWVSAPRDNFSQFCAQQEFPWVPGVLLKSWTTD